MAKEKKNEMVIAGQNQTAFSSPAAFEAAQRMANAICCSTIVPDQYRGKDNIGNAIVALEMAQRIGASPMAVMQNLNIIHGKPSFSSTFIIASLNSCGRFAPLRFEMAGEGDKRQCYAWTKDRLDGERLEGPVVSIKMAKEEGWLDKKGSKWKTMPELMLRYRAAAFFGRLYAPDVMMGMQAEEEIVDVVEVREITPAPDLVEVSIDEELDDIEESAAEESLPSDDDVPDPGDDSGEPADSGTGENVESTEKPDSEPEISLF